MSLTVVSYTDCKLYPTSPYFVHPEKIWYISETAEKMTFSNLLLTSNSNEIWCSIHHEIQNEFVVIADYLSIQPGDAVCNVMFQMVLQFRQHIYTGEKYWIKINDFSLGNGDQINVDGQIFTFAIITAVGLTEWTDGTSKSEISAESNCRQNMQLQISLLYLQL